MGSDFRDLISDYLIEDDHLTEGRYIEVWL